MSYEEVNKPDTDMRRLTPDKFIKGLGLAIFSYVILGVVTSIISAIVHAIIDFVFDSDINILRWIFLGLFQNRDNAHWLIFVFSSVLIYNLYKWSLSFLKIKDDIIIKVANYVAFIFSCLVFILGLITIKNISASDLILVLVFGIAAYKIHENKFTLE